MGANLWTGASLSCAEGLHFSAFHYISTRAPNPTPQEGEHSPKKRCSGSSCPALGDTVGAHTPLCCILCMECDSNTWSSLCAILGVCMDTHVFTPASAFWAEHKTATNMINAGMKHRSANCLAQWTGTYTHAQLCIVHL